MDIFQSDIYLHNCPSYRALAYILIQHCNDRLRNANCRLLVFGGFLLLGEAGVRFLDIASFPSLPNEVDISQISGQKQ